MTKIDLSGATSIGEKAVAALNQLTSVTMPKQDYTIGKQSFAACKILTTIDLTNASAIGETAFQSCDNLTAVFINRATPPTVVVKSGKTPFDQCNAALTIYVPKNYIANYEGSPLYSFIDKGANTIFYTTTDNTTLTLSNAAWGEGEGCIYTYHSFANNVGKIILKSGVTTLPANAFAEQYTLKSFVLPMCITTVSDSAFRKCYNLESISMPNVTVIGAEAFSMEGCPAGTDLVNTLKITHLDLSNVETFGAKAFYHVSSITSIDISGAINIGNEALGQLGRLTSVTMPAKGNNCVLGKGVFTQSASLIKIDLSGVQEMGAWQFTNSQNLKTIIIDRDTPPTIVADENGDKKLWWNQHNYLNQKIYVPNDLVTTYQQHEDWSQYANKIKPISEMPQ